MTRYGGKEEMFRALARARLDELDEERAEIIDAFPDFSTVRFTAKVVPVDPRVHLLKAAHAAAASYVTHEKRKYRKHSSHYKEDVVKRILGGKALRHVAKEESLSPSMVKRWLEQSGEVEPPKIDEKLYAILEAIPDDGAIHYTQLAPAIGATLSSVRYHLTSQHEAGHVKPIGKGMWKKTKKGLEYQRAIP